MCIKHTISFFTEKLFQRIHYLARAELLGTPPYVVHVQIIMFQVFMISERDLLGFANY